MPTRDKSRNDTQVQLQTNKREEGLQKLRAMAAAANANATAYTTEIAMIAIVNATGAATTAPTMTKVWGMECIGYPRTCHNLPKPQRDE